MQISSRFTIAVHIFACVSAFEKDRKVTSDFLASSVNANPVIIRKILGMLKNAGLVTITRGSGGVAIAVAPDEITLYDIYRAVECVDGQLFRFHENPNPLCPVGRNIHKVMDEKLIRIQNAMEQEMKAVTIADVIRDTMKEIEKEEKSGA